LSTGLLKFLDIESKIDWVECVVNLLNSHSIDYKIESDHIKFQFFVDFDVWSDCNLFFTKIEKSGDRIVNSVLFGMIKNNKSSVTIIRESVSGLLLLLNNMICIFSSFNDYFYN